MVKLTIEARGRDYIDLVNALRRILDNLEEEHAIGSYNNTIVAYEYSVEEEQDEAVR